VDGLDSLREYVGLVVERAADEALLRKANSSYIAVAKLLYRLQAEPKRAFDKIVNKVGGRYGVIDLERVLSGPEYEGLKLGLVDHETAQVKRTVSSTANRYITPDGRSYLLSVYFNPGPNLTDAEYNRAFRASVLLAPLHPKNREHYVHEFVHVMDFRRMSDEYLMGRSSAKLARMQRGEKKDFRRYMNDPLETNAFTHQSFTRVKSMLKGARTRAAWEAVMGRSPHEFVDKFMSTYLDKRARKHWSEDNLRKLAKRAAAFYQSMAASAPE